ncbi:hypothetical protein [Aliikangiella coralliicola]|uniref:hypothetical protein n=1 Tax=Aliikangiella coralliicola TaxID=2592383 RepID=UPI00143CD325|nr:hypothetical protein [Aliikangiella coralliicola]
MSSYQIVDEPKVRGTNALIFNPLIILFVSILTPLFWNPPLMGRFWMPMIWIIINGVLLGSHSLKKEILAIIIGAAVFFATLYGTAFISVSSLFDDPDSTLPYLRIFLQAIFFSTLYVVVFMQSASYSIYEYIREQDE